MKILLVARWPVGGIRTYLRYVFRHEVMGRYEFAMVGPRETGVEAALESFRAGPCRQVVTDASTVKLLKAVWYEVRLWRPDLIHSHGFTSGVISAPVARLARTPHLLTSHDVLFSRQFPGLSGRLRRAGVGIALRSIDHVMAVGEDALRNLQEFYPMLACPRRSSAIRNGIDVQAFATNARRDLRGELGLGPDVLLLGFFGRFMAQKGFDLLIDAVAACRGRGANLNVVCFGWGGFIREEQSALRERGLDGHFHFLPHTEDVALALRGVDAAVMPSRWEACPLLPMEALVAGAPLIASDCIGMREVTKDTPALVFQNGNVDGLIARVLELAARGAELNQLSDRFREEAARRFDSANAARDLAALYARLTGRR